MIEEATQKLQGIVNAYSQLVDKIVDLAEFLHVRPEWLMAHIFPKSAKDRANTARILAWWNKEDGWIKKHINTTLAAKKRAAARQQIIAAKGLTEEELKILAGK